MGNGSEANRNFDAKSSIEAIVTKHLRRVMHDATHSETLRGVRQLFNCLLVVEESTRSLKWIHKIEQEIG